MSDDLIERLRADDTDPKVLRQAADRIETLEAMLEAQDENCASLLERYAALIAAGDRLAGFAGHDDECDWADRERCDCGYTEAWKAWKEARGDAD